MPSQLSQMRPRSKRWSNPEYEMTDFANNQPPDRVSAVWSLGARADQLAPALQERLVILAEGFAQLLDRASAV
ncbi:hypothetical protein GCM10007857_69760 [Bradyrhizobium iriomotense]|uniref:Uncharacterized protein n=2 Tax=Bradyrhizobium iriomotense TaxID=441950 RepID=A0ABQ6B766_9BRAD|nr:hypothetical protein GCM10007857_69760 [Bradyrhizobium iriomotense]